MRPIRKEWTSIIPQPLDVVWDFFSRPENLNELTPEGVSFNILSPIEGQVMHPGMIIQYRISPFLGITFDWVSEITQISDRRYFIDDQRVGPYALWHHQHHFVDKGDHTEMRDVLHYQVPFGVIGSIANVLFVEKQVDQIFAFREKSIRERFEKG